MLGLNEFSVLAGGLGLCLGEGAGDFFGEWHGIAG